jgi:hypothetical protein
MAKTKGARKSSRLDDWCVPARIADANVRAAHLDMRAQWMLSFIDGRLCLGDVLAMAGLPVEEARQGVSDLVIHGIVVLE